MHITSVFSVADSSLPYPCNATKPVYFRYSRTLKYLLRYRRFRNHPKNHKKALRADKKIKVIDGRLVRELECNHGDMLFKEQPDIFPALFTATKKLCTFAHRKKLLKTE